MHRGAGISKYSGSPIPHPAPHRLPLLLPWLCALPTPHPKTKGVAAAIPEHPQGTTGLTGRHASVPFLSEVERRELCSVCYPGLSALTTSVRGTDDCYPVWPPRMLNPREVK